MRKIKFSAILIGIILIVFSLSGCVTYDNFRAAFIDKAEDNQSVIQIGVLEPVTGSDSKEAEAEIRGIQLANSVHPNVDGKIIELVFSDTKSDIDAAETAAETLIVKKPEVILGSYGSVYSLAAGSAIEKAKIPAIAITNTNPLVTKNNDYYFRVCYVDSNQGDLLAQYVVEEKNETTAGILLPSDDDAALAMATSFSDRIKAETGDEDAIVAYEEYPSGTTDYTKQLEAIEASGVKSVILPGDALDCRSIINQAADMGMDVQFLGGTEWGEESFCKKLSADVNPDQFAFVSFFASDDSENASDSSDASSKEKERFLDAYHKKYGEDSEPEDAVALGYDAYLVAIDAYDKADGKKTGKDIKNILMDPQYSFDGASGYINFSSTGDPIKTAYITTWVNGKTSTIYTVEPKKY